MGINNWRQVLPALAQSADSISCQLLDSANIISLPQNSTVFRQGDACKNYLIVLHGKVKVFTRAENGREILLYRLAQGDSCVLTTSCLFGHNKYPAEGETETAVTALAIAEDPFNNVLKSSEIFREMVFSAFSSHLGDLITLIEEVAFGKLDVRLARLLLDQCDKDFIFHTTHQNIATELGSVREVISRQLKELESKGYIELNRGNIRIIDKQAIRKISSV